MNAYSKEQITNCQQAILESMSLEMIYYSQAISTCAVFAELNQLKADIDEIVECLFQRFNGFVEKSNLFETIEHVLKYAIKIGLVEEKEQGVYSPTRVGMFLGQDWFKKLQADN